jgi:hypothetical protein
MGQCLACDGMGPVQTLCTICRDSGLLYLPKAESNESGRHELGKEPSDPSKLEPNDGKCTKCNGPGTIGESCPDCKEDGGIYLNFHAGL